MKKAQKLAEFIKKNLEVFGLCSGERVVQWKDETKYDLDGYKDLRYYDALTQKIADDIIKFLKS